MTHLFFALAEPLARCFLWQLPPETAHNWAQYLIRSAPDLRTPVDTRLQTHLAGRNLPHPIGLAAGFDKSARMLHGLFKLGFSFVETGTVTPRPQAGNPKPRLFRLPRDKALINRLGFNNDGLETFAARLVDRPKDGLLGANIGINKSSDDPIGDFALNFERCAPLADYVTVNVSSPNTPGLRDLQDPATLDKLLGAMLGDAASPTPLYLKLAPDLATEQLLELVELAEARQLAGLILCNTTIARPPNLQERSREESGGLSGLPLRSRAKEILKMVAERSAGRLQLISVGGLYDGRDLFERLAAGAHAVQIYTSFIYKGPSLIAKLHRELLAEMDKNGIASIEQLHRRHPIAA